MNDKAALRFESVSHSFAVDGKSVSALKNINLSIKPGRITGLIGPDAAGKTTLMRLACGLLSPDEGRIFSFDIDVVQTPINAQSSMGYMPQRFGLYEDLSVQENLDLYADLQGLPAEERESRYRELMHMTGLGPFGKRLAGRLSGGMKQKLGLACTLVGTPRLLLLDEPTVGVDPVSRRELWTIIQRLVDQQGTSVLLSTAYLDEAERCNELVLLHQGQILDQGNFRHFSEPMRGRIFLLDSTTSGKRDLLYRLGDRPGIVDAVIDNEKVRVITGEAGDRRAIEAALSDMTSAHIEAAEPRFEDAFVATLKGKATGPKNLDIRPASGELDENVIQVVGVKKRFGDFYAVRDISFEVRRGEVFGLLGANGAGKSTTFRMLCGLLPPTDGKLTVAGQNLRRAGAQVRGHLGYMAQRFSLYVDLTVRENLNFFASAYGLNRHRRVQRIDWALTTFELERYANSASGDLALGYKQRLAMAAALLHEPDILFLDEPTSGVDPLARREFWQRINALAKSGVTVLVTTHFMEEANYCDRLVIMAEGELLAEGTPAEMKERFKTEQQPNPSMEDAFIGLIEARGAEADRPQESVA
ncbi:MAG: ATP-binding cassette domain-containing protein [Halioglobus sp.]|jgi:ABC-2 type transport system ATP-binding protein